MSRAPLSMSRSTPVVARRRHGARLVTMIVIAVAVLIGLATSASADASVTRDDAIKQLDVVRTSIDTSLSLLDAGKRDEAFAQARDGYLEHFELVEIPLRVADPDLTVQAEGVFAEIRELIRSGASTAEVRTKLVELRGLIDESERRLTDVGVGAPALVFGQAFLIIFREGLEVVLLLAVLLGYLESSKAGHYRRPVLIGVALAVAASVVTLVALQTVFAHLPVGREILEAVTSLVAVGVLFWVSFWLISRLDQKRWMEFLKARVWRAVSVGSTASLIMLGFTAVYREGFETALFYQALLSFGTGLGAWVAAGLAAGLVALTAITTVIFRLGRKLPVATFLKVAVIAVMLTSVAFLGNAVHGLQEAFLVPRTALGVPRLPIFLSQATGFWPTVQTVAAQVVLALIYLAGGVYAFVIKPRRDRVEPTTSGSAADVPKAEGSKAAGSKAAASTAGGSTGTAATPAAV
jgi:high-affinity iron transporter